VQRGIDTELSDIRNKAAYDQRQKEAEDLATQQGMIGRMYGEKNTYTPPEPTETPVPDEMGNTPRPYKPITLQQGQAASGDRNQALAEALKAGRSVGSDDQLEEITPTGKYTYDPKAAMQMAMTPQGLRAMQQNPLLAAGISAAMKPKDLEMAGIDPSKFTPESIQKARSTGNYAELKPIATTAKVDFQRKTREYTDAQGNKWSQDYNFNPATGQATNVGSPYKTNIAPTSASAKESAEGLRKEYTNQTSQYRSVADAWQKIQKAAAAPSAANDISMIYGYMRINDPTSTVREGEFATAQNAAGVPTQVLNMYNRVLKGERLSEEQRQDFVKSAYDLVESQMPNAQAMSDRYSAIAKRSSLNPEDVVYDPFASSHVPKLQGENDPNYGKLKSGDLFFGPDGVMRRKK
jgi:hypothetical protein